MWSLRLWYGMGLGAWLKLLARNGFAVTPRRWPMACLVTAVAAGNAVLGHFQRLCLGRALAGVRLSDAPVFIIGHWRTGTTFLHELLSLDERHACPNSYECFCPIHSLLTGRLARACLGPFLPDRRPMDGMVLGWDRPQEDEFALCALGLPSPYRMIAFPGNPTAGDDADLNRLAPEARRQWEQGLLRFLRQVTYRTGRRLVLKSPTHTFRIAALVRLFPEARFIHLVRHPVEVFASSIRMWQALFEMHALQRPLRPDLEDQVLDTLDRMYERLQEDRDLVGPSRFCDLRYEDLVRDPIGQLRRLYEQLELGPFDPVLPAVERYLAAVKGHRPTRYTLPPAVRERVMRRWHAYAERYDYLDPPSPEDAAVASSGRS